MTRNKPKSSGEKGLINSRWMHQSQDKKSLNQQINRRPFKGARKMK